MTERVGREIKSFAPKSQPSIREEQPESKEKDSKRQKGVEMDIESKRNERVRGEKAEAERATSG